MTQLGQALVHVRAGRWDEAHRLAQEDHSELGAWLHGILHIQQGDLENAAYWYGKARRDFRGCGSLDEEVARFEAALAQSLA
ncbi:MAG TPA: hypothetical protein VE934_16905 [Polaromonas sp.]|uniref:hypothetical protein n=1 Tax=Polaromonas sp. TaxID=1869339 RepID=UPI002D693AFF|nr:hypothetical protein [Polaromonas sp.]HYW58631.1 hypothetical protein [Polaromonas sp.]